MLNVMQEGWLKYFNNWTPEERNPVLANISSTLLANFWNHVDKPVVFDKHRAWARNIGGLRSLFGETVQVVATVRPVEAVLASFIKLIKQNPGNNYVDRDLLKEKRQLSLENRCDVLWKTYVSDPWTSLRIGLNEFPENMYLVDYDSLCSNPTDVLNKLYTDLGLEPFDHVFDNIANNLNEVDESWGLLGLHDIRSTLSNTAAKPSDVLTPALCEQYSKYNFWTTS